MLQPITKAYGSAVIAVHLTRLRLPFRSRERVRAARDAAVRRIVAHAAATVPYYRELFARERIDPRSIRTAEDLERLPLLDKETVRDDPRRFLSRSRAGRTAVRFTTSGTTGTPLEVWHDRRSLLANLAYGERERRIIVETCGAGLRPRDMTIVYPSSTFLKVWSFYERHTLLPARPRRSFASVLDPLDAVVRRIDEQRPDVLVTYGSFAELLFRYAADRGLGMHLPRMVLYVADAMSAPGRALIEERFGIPVFSRYNAVEAFKIGFLCGQRDGFHVHEDLCHARVVGADGKTAQPGDQGEVVISNLVNRATVLLNYRIGDVASWSDAPCACGRSLAKLRELDGRREDYLIATDGSPVHPRAVWGTLKEQPGLLQYQIVQAAPDRFALRLVTRDAGAFESITAAALPALSALLGPAARIDAERVETLLPEGGGKVRPVSRLF